MEPEILKEKFGSRIVFWVGGVDTRLATKARPDIDKSLLIRTEDIANTVLFMLKLSGTAWGDEITVRRRATKPF